MPGAHLPLEPWEDSNHSAPPSPTTTRGFATSPVLVGRRKLHSRRPTLSVIRDSRMFFDGENVANGETIRQEAPETGETRSTPGASQMTHDQEWEEHSAEGASATSSSLSLERREEGRQFVGVLDDPDDRGQAEAPTPPPKSPSSHARSLSGASTESAVPSLCPSSPTSSSSGCPEPSLYPHSPTPAQSPLPQPHVRIDADRPGNTAYSDSFAHHRSTQFITNDLLASLDYNYSDALTHLGNGASTLRTSALFPQADFEPGSSAGTIKNIPSSATQSAGRAGSPTSIAESQWSAEPSDINRRSALRPPLSPYSLAETPSSSFSSGFEYSSAESSAISSPALSRSPSYSSRSSSAVSSEYDFGDDDYGYYSYDLGSFHDPLGTPSTAQRRPVFGYGIPWPSSHRTSGTSGGSGGSGGSMHDVLSDLEDLAEDLTERLRSSNDSVRSSSLSGGGDVFGGGELADAAGGDSSSRRSGRPSGGSSQTAAGGSTSNGHSGYQGSFNGRGGYRGREHDDEDSDDDRKGRPRRLPAAHAAVTDSDTDSEDSGSDDYGEDRPNINGTRERHDTVRAGLRSPVPPMSEQPPSPRAENTDDDVPLARQIPGALKAQKTIRRQVRDELDQKRAERHARRAQKALLLQQQQTEEQRPTRALSSAAESTLPIQQQHSSPSKPVGRPRTRTLPSTMNSPFHPGDLTKKLLGLKTGSSPTTVDTPPVPVPASSVPRSKRPSFDTYDQYPSRGRAVAGDPTAYSASVSRHTSRPPPQESSRTLRPMRSFHRPRTAEGDLAPPLPPSVPQPSAGLQRNGTTASRRRPAVEEPPVSSLSTLSRARSVKADASGRPSLERTPPPETISSGSRARSATSASGPGATFTPAPASTFSQPGKAQVSSGQMWQQRVFIGNMQRFCLVEIGSATCAGDVLKMVDGQGVLEECASNDGGWMLWEVSQDFGMGQFYLFLWSESETDTSFLLLPERPIRNFEMLNDVCGSWNSDKTVNLLVIKKTQLAPFLSSKAMPLSSPVCSGYVQWEYKRGKWQKRWMELREHSLWLSKRDNVRIISLHFILMAARYLTDVRRARTRHSYVRSTISTRTMSLACTRRRSHTSSPSSPPTAWRTSRIRPTTYTCSRVGNLKARTG